MLVRLSCAFHIFIMFYIAYYIFQFCSDSVHKHVQTEMVPVKEVGQSLARSRFLFIWILHSL